MWIRAAIAGVCVILASPLAERVAAQEGRVVEWTEHGPTGMRSAWLSSGVRVHHKHLGEPDDKVSITIRLVGGALEEDEGNRGITQAAMAAWAEPRTERTPPEAMAARLERAGIGYEAGIIDADMVGMTLTAPPGRVREALAIASELIGSASIDESALSAWRDRQRGLIDERATDAKGRLKELIAESLFPPGDPRVRPLVPADVERLGPEEVGAWLRRLCAESPIEVGIAGPVPAPLAMQHAAETLGALPARARIDQDTLAAARVIGPRPEGPIVRRRVCEGCEESVALVGFYAPDRRDAEAMRRVLSGMILLEHRLREIDWGFEARIRVDLLLGRAFPGFGMLHVTIEAPASRVKEAAARVDEEIDRLASKGPGKEEMRRFHAGAQHDLDKLLATSRFWSERLALTTSIGNGLDELGTLVEAYTTIEGEKIRESFAAYATPANRFRLTVLGGASEP